MKKVLVGCGFALLLLAALIAGLILAWPKISKRATGWAQQKFDEIKQQGDFEDAWKPPTAQPDEQWFPAEFAGWKRFTAAPIQGIPELDLTRDGHSATYEQNGKRIELKIVPVTRLETEGLLTRARGLKPQIENHGMTWTYTSGSTVELKFGDRERYYCRPLKEWFLYEHTLDGAEPQPFTDAWMHGVSQAPPPAVGPEPAK